MRQFKSQKHSTVHLFHQVRQVDDTKVGMNCSIRDTEMCSIGKLHVPIRQETLQSRHSNKRKLANSIYNTDWAVRNRFQRWRMLSIANIQIRQGYFRVERKHEDGVAQQLAELLSENALALHLESEQ